MPPAPALKAEDVMSRILLADDSPHAQRMGERILREEGYEVVSVTDGDTALKRLADVDPDLIVCDVFLPGVNGFDLCRKVKAAPRHRHVRVVMTAGTLEVFDEDEARRAGADAIIKKPFEASVVMDTIKPLIVEAHLARGIFPQTDEQQAPVSKSVSAPSRYEVVVVDPEPDSVEEAEYVPEEELPLPDEYDEEPEPLKAATALPSFAAPVVASPIVSTPIAVPPPTPSVAVPLPTPTPAAIAMPQAGIDPELVRAAVTIALDEAIPSLIDDITERVLAALRQNQ